MIRVCSSKIAEKICSFFYDKAVCWCGLLAYYDEERDKDKWFNRISVKLAKVICRYLYKKECCIIHFYPDIKECPCGKKLFTGSYKLYEWYTEGDGSSNEDVYFQKVKHELFFDERDIEDCLAK